MKFFELDDRVTIRRDVIDGLVKTGKVTKICENGRYHIEDDSDTTWWNVPEQSMILITSSTGDHNVD